MAEILTFPGYPRYNPDPVIRDAIATLKEQRGDRLDGCVIVSADAVSIVMMFLDDMFARMIPPPASWA